MPISKDPQSRKWCFTLNNYTPEEYKYICDYATSNNCKYIVAKELGEEKTPHLQMYFKFNSARRFSTMKRIFVRSHIEKARGSDKQNYEYCSKEGDFITNLDFRTFKEKVADLCLQEYKDTIWKSWQRDILEIKNDQRTINWYYEGTGNVGKSYLCKYLALTRNAIICEGKKTDIFCQVSTMLDNEKLPELIICDIPRTAIDYINYGALEQLKNGMLYSGKYEGGRCIFPPPLVICFANTPPNLTALSTDRWNVKLIS